MKIAVLGTRGFPGVQGGVEAHCENLYSKLAGMDCEITIFTRSPYVDPQVKLYKNIRLVPIGCPKSRSLEAIIHTFRGILAARRLNPDILHIHGVGPSLLVPLARMLGLKVVMTNHGPDYEREKWGAFAKLVLRLGERLGSGWSNEIICISRDIASTIREKYKREPGIIPNGVEIPDTIESDEILKKMSLARGRYILAVGRFVPEKGFDYLINAFNEAGPGNWKLVIAGRADHEDKYSLRLKEKARENPDIVLTGFLSGRPLQELYSHAGLFVIPSYYEGLPLVLLEAMSYGLLCLASDIPANRNIGLADENYFKAGNIKHLSRKLKEFVKRGHADSQRIGQIKLLESKYNWDGIAHKTLEIYKKVINA